MIAFNGTKIALLYQGKLVMFLRDNTPGLRFANMWDFFGGGREGEETPIECAIREIEEELCITLKPEAFIWQKEYPAMHDATQIAYFLVAHLTKDTVDNIQFGSEGQKWDLISIEDFFAREDVVPPLKGRLKDYLESIQEKEVVDLQE